MYAYPQRPGATALSSSTAFTPQQQQPAYVPPPPPVVAPGLGLANPAAQGSITTLRLKVSEDIRIDPMVVISAELLSASGPQTLSCPDLSRERQLVAEASNSRGSPGKRAQHGVTDSNRGSSSGSVDVDAYLAGFKSGELPVDPAVMQLAVTGVSPAAAALGVVYARAGRGVADMAAEFASGLEKLTTMGFPLPLAAGALAKHKGNLEAATESCLSTAS